MDTNLKKRIEYCYKLKIRKIRYGVLFRFIRQYELNLIDKNVSFILKHKNDFDEIEKLPYYYDSFYRFWRMKPKF